MTTRDFGEAPTVPSDGVPVPPGPTTTLASGDQLGERYRIVRFIAQGGMGEVYEADDRVLGKRVALKTVRRGLADDDSMMARFRREIRIAHAVTHPNVCRVHDVGFAPHPSGEVTFLSMELLEGETLAAWLRREGAMKVAAAAPLVAQMASALAAAHRLGVIHRDFKPPNVMLVPDKAGGVRAVVTDFGLARRPAASDGSLSTEAGQALVGTPGYMAPEQVTGEPLTPAADVYALGVVLYEMLTGRLPFAGSTPLSLAVKRLDGPPPPPRAHVPGLDPAWDALIMRCLARRAEDRPGDGGAVLAALPVAALRSRRAWWTVGLVAVALALIVALVVGRRDAPAVVAPRPDAAIRGVAITDLPDPATGKPEALAAFREGLALTRGGGSPTAALRRAVALDPGFPAANLVLAWWIVREDPAAAGRYLETANAGRHLLSPRDRTVLAVVSRVVPVAPSDWAGAAARIDEALRAYPADAELHALAAWVTGNLPGDGNEARTIALARRALALDPDFAGAYAPILAMDLRLGELEEAERAARACIAISPAATSCRRVIVDLLEHGGRCDLVEREARQWIAASPSDPEGYERAAGAAYALGRPIETVDDLWRQSALRAPDREDQARQHEQQRAILHGDFAGALATARARAAGHEKAGNVRQLVLAGADRAELLLEMGQGAEAGRVAAELLARQEAWVVDDPGCTEDAAAASTTWRLVALAYRGGASSVEAYRARRDELVRAWTSCLPAAARAFLWPVAYARGAHSREDALEALAFAPALPTRLPDAALDGEVARVLRLGGRTAAARPYLAAGVRCRALDHPLAATAAQLELGLALEELGDREGACAAFGVVLERWGKATPASATAALARAGAGRLRCTTK